MRELGLTERQSRGYVAAVELVPCSPAELAAVATIPPRRVDDVVAALEDRGLVSVRDGSSDTEIVPHSIETARDTLRDGRADGIDDADDESAARRGADRLGYFVTMVGTRRAALRHAGRVLENAQWRATLAVPPAVYDTLADDVRAAADRGVRVSIVVHDDPDAVADLEFPDDTEVRTRPLADTIVAADRRYAVYSSQSPHRSRGSYVVTKDESPVFCFQNYFHQFWVGSEPIHDATGSS